MLGCAGLYWAVPGCTGLNWAVLGCTGLYWAVLGCTGMYWTLLLCTGLYWAESLAIFLCIQPFSAWWQTNNQPNNQVILVQACSWPVWEGNLLQKHEHDQQEGAAAEHGSRISETKRRSADLSSESAIGLFPLCYSSFRNTTYKRGILAYFRSWELTQLHS